MLGASLDVSTLSFNSGIIRDADYLNIIYRKCDLGFSVCLAMTGYTGRRNICFHLDQLNLFIYLSAYVLRLIILRVIHLICWW